MNFFKQYSPFQKIFFIFFITATIISFFIPVLTHSSKLFGLLSIFSIIALISSFSGIFTSIYQVRASLIFYFWWVINTITYALISLHENLYGQFILNIFIILPLEIVGFIAWKKHMNKTKKKSIEIKKFKPYMWLISLPLFVPAWFIYAQVLSSLPYIFKTVFAINIPSDGQILLDSFTSVATIFAVYLISKRYLEQWHFWILANLGVILFIKNIISSGVFSASDLSGMIVQAQYLIISIYGLFYWLKLHKKASLKEINLTNQKNPYKTTV